MLISSLNNRQTVLFTKHYVKSLLSDTAITASRQEYEERIISNLVITILKLPYINTLFFSFFRNTRHWLTNGLDSRIWQIWPRTKIVKQLYHIADIQNSKIMKKLVKLHLFFIKSYP
jgi:hypothetical protein